MEKNISCCGMVCSSCRFYPRDCAGCAANRGKVFWLRYTGEGRCPVYSCCMIEKHLPHCGRCSLLPCGHYDAQDPTLSKEENEKIRGMQLEQLKSMD